VATNNHIIQPQFICNIKYKFLPIKRTENALEKFAQMTIKVPPIAFQLHFCRLTLTFNPGRATVMSHIHAKSQHQKSLGSDVKSENRWMNRHTMINGWRRLHYLPW